MHHNITYPIGYQAIYKEVLPLSSFRCSSISGRYLYSMLAIEGDYNYWIEQMCYMYGFKDGYDYICIYGDYPDTSQVVEIIDHTLGLPMAIRLCQIHGTGIALQISKFLEISLIYPYLYQENRWLQSQIFHMYEYNKNLYGNETVAISTIAREYGFDACQLNSYLYSKGIQYPYYDIWVLHPKYQYGNTVLAITGPFKHGRMYTRWTRAGHNFIYNVMKKDGILPLNERMR